MEAEGIMYDCFRAHLLVEQQRGEEALEVTSEPINKFSTLGMLFFPVYASFTSLF